MEIKFLITEDSINNMSAADYEAFERAQDGDIKLYRLRPAICRFMVDAKNVPVPFAQALKISEQMKVKEMKDFIAKFFDLMRERAIPKESGSPLKSPTEAEQTDSPSLAG